MSASICRWQDTHFSARRSRFLVSYIPSLTDCSCVQPLPAWGSSHFSAGPWQPSQCTPSVMSNFGPRSAGLAFTAWHTRQRSLCSALAMLSFLAIPDGLTLDLSFSLISVSYPLACFSFWYQTMFSLSLGSSALALVLP